MKSIEINIISNDVTHDSTFNDYLILDDPNGRFYTYYAINERNTDLNEFKICIDNIQPSFEQKLNLKRLLNYSNILLKSLNSVNCSVLRYNTLSCLINKCLVDEFEKPMGNAISNQNIIPNVGHFKLIESNKIFIQYIDKVKVVLIFISTLL
jgi:hypothetical protein